MPTISVFYWIVIMMRQPDKEHNPPHIHAMYSGQEASFAISDGKLLDGKLPIRAIAMVREFILLNQSELLNMWNTRVFKRLKGLE